MTKKLTRRMTDIGSFDTPQAREKLLSGHWMVRLREDESPPLADSELQELWQAIGAEPAAEFSKDHPGERCWATWHFDLLPVDRRKRLEPDEDEPATSDRPPRNLLDLGPDAFEGSYRYLQTRGLLLAGEVDRIVAKYSGAIESALDFYRQNLERIDPKYRPNAMLYAHQWADFAELFGDELLTGDELSAAAPFRFTNGKAH